LSLAENGTHLSLLHADDFNTLRTDLHVIKENAGVLIAATKKIGVE
jgi:hypothetical protein